LIFDFPDGILTLVASRSRRVRDSRRSIFGRSAETADSAEGGGRVRCKRAVRRPTNGLALAGPKAQGSATKTGRPGGALSLSKGKTLRLAEKGKRRQGGGDFPAREQNTILCDVARAATCEANA